MGETSRGDASSIEDVSLSWSGGLTLVESYLEEEPFEGFHDDVEIGSATPSMGRINSIVPSYLTRHPFHPPSFPPSPPTCIHFMSP